ncbi:formate dehydrogenase-N subunit alpha [Desulfuribacillus alkaliarsenatis]|uniref:Formate dehydrogenase-N subunit alpha n=1 Tax=Desulfuribacillus alkaliarsenatis TaxID=766136 RepID=A0A1E5G241_9FIRM|nr:formate dehydrogenase-N subunit alpha [Desulfuribacillus alkaliarsenatis]
MTNHWTDFRNTDVALICGSNAAENHPLSFKWLMDAREQRDCKIIHVDPRFTRTSAVSDLYCPIRSGSNIAFYGGMINYILENSLEHRDYVLHYTNAALIVSDGYSFDDATGLFDSYNDSGRSYNTSNWSYKLDEDGKPLKDMTLSDSRCVYQILKQHYARYTLEKVAASCGAPIDKLQQVYDIYCTTGESGKAGSILYAMGQTQFTSGSQNIRAMAIIQLLLGNIGIPGAGVNALRGHSNVQGSTDMACLFHLLPGYLPAPTEALPTLAEYNATTPAAPAWWSNRPKYIASMLKAWFGDAATEDNDFGYGWIPKRRATGRAYHHQALFENMNAEIVKGMITWGQNPVVAGPNTYEMLDGLDKLEWLVCLDPFETETAAYWKRPGANPASINTEVFLLPMETFFEKEGTVTHSGRLIQYRWKAVDAPGNVRSESWVLDRLTRTLKSLYAGSNKPEDAGFLAMTWDYPDPEASHANFIDAVMREINGRDLTTGKLMNNFIGLQEDGSTDCGCWIYSGMYTETHGNRTKSRMVDDPGDWGAYLGWGFAWPVNRRIIYNRASVDANGKPWAGLRVYDPKEGKLVERKYMEWSQAGGWSGYDVVDGGAPLRTDSGELNGPFIMFTELVGRLFAIGGLADGPLPEHYEPWESPTDNTFNGRQNNPAHFIGKTAPDTRGDYSEYPIICSTWRVCEHWHTGATTRNMPWLAELMPESFIEIGKDLAASKGIKNGETVEILSKRGAIKAVAMVTARSNKFNINGKEVHQVGMTWHFGYKGLVQGEMVNNLTAQVGDSNTQIPEYKAFLVDVRKVNA